MKKQVLIGSVLLAAIGAFSQTGSREKPTGLFDTRTLARVKFGVESSAPVSIVNPVKPTIFPKGSGSKTSQITNTWQNISWSMNVYGVSNAFTKPLQWNDELNAVSFIYRKSSSYAITPAPVTLAETGGILAMVSTNWGTTWDSMAIFSDNTLWGRYPNGAIYNPPMTPANTDINNAYVVGAGACTSAGVTNIVWTGNWFASRQLGSANYNGTLSTVPNAYQAIPTGPPFAPGFPSRMDFVAYSFAATDDGKMRVLGGIQDDAISPNPADSAFMLVTGTFTNGAFEWRGEIFDPPTTVAADGSENLGPRYLQAWNEMGTVGYVLTMGQRLATTGANTGMQPIVYKTTNSGATWSLEDGIDFNLPEYDVVRGRLWPVASDSTLNVPNFTWLEGHDCAVDVNNKLHIFTSLLGQSSNHPDSLNFISQFSTEKYLWPHKPIDTEGHTIHPYLYDFIYDGTNSTPKWSYMTIDSMSSEGPGQRTTDGGYNDNPWDPDPTSANQKIRLDARLQMSRTPDGKNLLYTWTESDTAYTDGVRKWNVLPNIKARLFDAELSEFSPTEVNVTVDADGEIANRAFFQCVSPKSKLAGKTVDLITVQVPMTISSSNPFAQTKSNNHWYSSATLEFARPITTGIAKENKLSSAINSSIYPNPAKGSATVRVNLNGSTKVQVEVLNTIGQVVKTTSTQGQAGVNSINVDLSGLSSGIYLVNVKVDNASSTKKLVIE